MESVVDLSIGIASYNTLELTRQCLRSIYENTEKICFEVCVVDNDSQDGSVEMIRQEFPQVNLISNPENVGVANATNQAIAVSRGRYFITMNSDTIAQPKALDTLVAFMDNHPEVGAASARLVRPDGTEHPPVCGNIPTLRSEILDALAPLSRKIAAAAKKARIGQPLDYTQTQQAKCITWGTAFIVRREVIQTVGGQDPRFWIYGEDTDWSIRIVKAGWKLYYIAEATILHYGGQSTSQALSKMTAHLAKSRCRLIQKHYGLLPGIILRCAIALVWSLRITKWLTLYVISTKNRREAVERLNHLLKIVQAVLTY